LDYFSIFFNKTHTFTIQRRWASHFHKTFRSLKLESRRMRLPAV
jgi:hypothetical protein